MVCKVNYIAAACNQTPNIVHWGKNGLICYGSSNVVLIYNLSLGGGKITHTLHKHKKRINAVKWITGCEYETELVSVSGDSNVVIWSCINGEYNGKILAGHTGIVNLVDALYTDCDKKSATVVSASDKSDAMVWKRESENDEFKLHQKISFGYNICISLRITKIPNDPNLLLAFGLDKSHILLYTEDKENNFQNCLALKGHEDWVRGLDFTIDENEQLLLATSSQDSFIRIWKFVPENVATISEKTFNIFTTLTNKYFIKVESVLAGHEGWVYSTNWSKSNTLLSASLDKMMVIWTYKKELDLWLDSDKVGEVGGNTLGFYGGMFNSEGDSIVAHSYHGAFHIWKVCDGLWVPQVTVGGHFNEVVDIAWDVSGEYIMSVSYDQTTRIHAPWRKNSNAEVTWHEIARPQVHGYDISCLALLGRYNFASGAEEKIIRTFQAPDNFVQNFRRICKIKEDISYNAPKGASVPSLGLSNKAVYENDNSEQATVKSSKDMYPEESHFTAVELSEPPTEETLIQNTLWPETQKLYGHGYEVYSLAASLDGKLLASACKATTTEHAAIILWDTQNWQIIQKLVSHTLTVAQIAFSPDCNHILSVSRDRRWSLFSKSSATNKFELSATTDKKLGIHTRIIWSCAWSHDSKYFATGSRDGKVVTWTRNENKQEKNILGLYESSKDVLNLPSESITALAFAPNLIKKNYLISVGFESGFIQLYKWNWEQGFQKVFELDNSSAHHLTTKRVMFRPKFGRAGYEENEDKYLQLASCSSDNSVRIYDIDLEQL